MEPDESMGAIGETAGLKGGTAGHHDLKTAGRDIKASGGHTRTTLDFAEMAAEFDWDRLWGSRTGSEIGQTFGINLCVGLLPTLFDVGMDSLAVRDYINGTYYYKQTGNYSDNCRLTEDGYTECYEKDPIFGYVTLTCFFLPGLGFSFWTFLSLSNYLRGEQSLVNFRQNLCFFLFFTPLAILASITFPAQLFIVNLVALLNAGTQWTTLTTKYSIAEGLYDASLQFCVQLFIIFVSGDRLPSTIQYLSLCGSILMLAIPRIDAYLLDQGGATMPVKEKLLKTLYLFPLFFFNSIFKLGSIGLICAILQYNAITLYGSVALLWTIFYFLFNEKVLPERHYHLILGVGLHAVSIGKIARRIKIIDTKIQPKKHHSVTSRKLTPRHQMQNMIFQNIAWLIINTIILVMVIVLTNVRSSLWVFWPIVDSRYSLATMPITKYCPIIVPVILCSGLLSLVLVIVQLAGCETILQVLCCTSQEEDDLEMSEQGQEEPEEAATDQDPSVQAKIAKKLEPVLNIVVSATDVEL